MLESKLGFSFFGITSFVLISVIVGLFDVGEVEEFDNFLFEAFLTRIFVPKFFNLCANIGEGFKPGKCFGE